MESCKLCKGDKWLIYEKKVDIYPKDAPPVRFAAPCPHCIGWSSNKTVHDVQASFELAEREKERKQHERLRDNHT